MSQTARTILVAGSHGVTALHFSKKPNAVVYGLSRHSDDLPGVCSLSADLLKPAEFFTELRENQ